MGDNLWEKKKRGELEHSNHKEKCLTCLDILCRGKTESLRKRLLNPGDTNLSTEPTDYDHGKVLSNPQKVEILSAHVKGDS